MNKIKLKIKIMVEFQFSLKDSFGCTQFAAWTPSARCLSCPAAFHGEEREKVHRAGSAFLGPNASPATKSPPMGIVK